MTSDVGDAVKTRPLLAEHERLLDHVAHIRVAAIELPSLSEEERHELTERIVSFLRDDLAPHAEREERGLYPHVARLLGDPRATQPMIYDHDAIRQLTARLQEAGNQDVSLLQELLYGTPLSPCTSARRMSCTGPCSSASTRRATSRTSRWEPGRAPSVLGARNSVVPANPLDWHRRARDPRFAVSKKPHDPP